jgi:hypothetical protein
MDATMTAADLATRPVTIPGLGRPLRTEEMVISMGPQHPSAICIAASRSTVRRCRTTSR